MAPVNIIIENEVQRIIMKDIDLTDFKKDIDGVKQDLENNEEIVLYIKEQKLGKFRDNDDIMLLKACEMKKKIMIIQLENYKTRLLLFKTLLDKKDLTKILPLIKSKIQENASKLLEIFQETLDCGCIYEGVYLRANNDTKKSYDGAMEEIEAIEKIVNGWEWSTEPC